jgi:hypothetical protein
MSEPLVTVLFYTSNREKEPFASRVRDLIMKSKGDLPLISVSQKPLDFGHNICVGEHSNCYYNEFRQILIGLKEVKTPYVLHAEADFIYPPEYFQFVPSEPKTYRYNNVWIVYRGGGRYFYKGQARVGAEINVTKDLLDELNKYFEGKPEWVEDPTFKRSYVVPPENDDVWGDNPVVSFKTGDGIRRHTNVIDGAQTRKKIPYWGHIVRLKRKMFQ